jgi:hypothetical protein
MKILVFIILLRSVTIGKSLAQTDSIKVSEDNFLRNYEVMQTFEVESLFPMFLTDGYHLAVCYRYDKFRFRISVINGGNYDAETAGLNNSSANFSRYYKTSPGFFLGYNIWKNLEVYTYIELHTFEIEQKNTNVRKDIHSTDFGGGISYQFFIGHRFYIQPGFHLYLRSEKSLNFDSQVYKIPQVDISPVIRVGYRFWRKY